MVESELQSISIGLLLMALLSSFELIVRPIIPSPFASSEFPNPVAVQAYFLLLSNFSNTSTSIILSFTANLRSDRTSTFNGGGIVPSTDKNFGPPVTAFLSFVAPTPLLSPQFKILSDSSAQTEFSIPSFGTALFLLQPDVSPLREFDQATEFFSYELRGLVEIESTKATSIFCSPQVRGTFFELGQKGELLAPVILQPKLTDELKEKLSLEIYDTKFCSSTASLS